MQHAACQHAWLSKPQPDRGARWKLGFAWSISVQSWAEAVFRCLAGAGMVTGGVEELDQTQQFRQVYGPVRLSAGIIVAGMRLAMGRFSRAGKITIFGIIGVRGAMQTA